LFDNYSYGLHYKDDSNFSLLFSSKTYVIMVILNIAVFRIDCNIVCIDAKIPQYKHVIDAYGHMVELWRTSLYTLSMAVEKKSTRHGRDLQLLIVYILL